MVTVDDLVISLTIKETSNLGKLKKQLDQLMSTKAGGKFEFSIPKKLFTDIRYIRESVNYLIPNTLYSFKQKEQFMEQSTRIALQMTKATDQFIDYLFSGRQAAKNIERYAKTFGIQFEKGKTPIEEVKQEVEKMLRLYIHQVIEKFYMYSEGIGLGEKADAISKMVTRMLSELKLSRVDPKTLFTNLYSLLEEDRAFWRDVFEKIGATVEEEVKLYGVRKDFFEKYEELSKKEKKLIDIDKWLEGTDEKLDNVFKSLESGQSSMDAFLKILGEQDYTKGEETLLDAINELSEKRIVEIMKSMFSVYKKTLERGEYEPFKPVLTTKMKELLMKELKMKAGIGDLTDLISIDLLISGKVDDLKESLTKLFGSNEKFLKNILETLKKTGQLFVELKSLFRGTQQQERKLEAEKSIAGESLVMIAQGITEKGFDRLEHMLIPHIELLNQYVKKLLGIVEPLKTEEELLEKIRKLVKERAENLDQRLNELADTVKELLEFAPEEEKVKIKKVIKQINTITQKTIKTVETQESVEKTNKLLENIINELKETTSEEIEKQKIEDLISSIQKLREIKKGEDLENLAKTTLNKLNELEKKVEDKDNELLEMLKELKKLLKSGNLPPRQEPKRGF
ncbi:MAG: hypothetical protein ACTSQY_00105 [Candidatus Odinarchaeia archaeon]|nr:MAG: hypothetical protein [Lokiarchaeota virus Fenrir Meg22_1012]URC17200.1 MAG: hypothetical protein [Lokiarchaeota virus Fenrir Meg22_1214]